MHLCVHHITVCLNNSNRYFYLYFKIGMSFTHIHFMVLCQWGPNVLHNISFCVLRSNHGGLE